MSNGDERVDRIIEALQQISVHLEGLRVTLSKQVLDSADHEERLRLIEHWRSQTAPVLAGGTFLLGVVISVAVRQWL